MEIIYLLILAIGVGLGFYAQTIVGFAASLVAFPIILNILEQLILLHEKGYPHSDVSTNNCVYLKRIGKWVLTDFGSCYKIVKDEN